MTNAADTAAEPRFGSASTLSDDALVLALAPALTPEDLDLAPVFFRGFLVQPKIYAQTLLVLAEITRTRYYVPPQVKRNSDARDPVFTAHGDRLRAEVFSACNSVAARVDLHAEGVDGGDIRFGTTNVDLGDQIQSMLAGIRSNELLHFEVGTDRVVASTPSRSETERKVMMPSRWIRGFGNVAEIQRGFSEEITLGATAARRFLLALPKSKTEHLWVRISAQGAKISLRPQSGALRITGAERLLPLQRIVTHIRQLRIYRDSNTESGVSIECGLLGITINLTLSEHPSRGFSGEGSLLNALASEHAPEDANMVSSVLGFDPHIDTSRLVCDTALPESRVIQALSFLAGSGRVGWDVSAGTYYHRELPFHPSQVLKDHPRLVSAQSLIDAHPIQWNEAGTVAWVRSGTTTYQVDVTAQSCTCAWHLRTRGSRGPCKHMLATTLNEKD